MANVFSRSGELINALEQDFNQDRVLEKSETFKVFLEEGQAIKSSAAWGGYGGVRIDVKSPLGRDLTLITDYDKDGIADPKAVGQSIFVIADDGARLQIKEKDRVISSGIEPGFLLKQNLDSNVIDRDYLAAIKVDGGYDILAWEKNNNTKNIVLWVLNTDEDGLFEDGAIQVDKNNAIAAGDALQFNFDNLGETPFNSGFPEFQGGRWYQPFGSEGLVNNAKAIKGNIYTNRDAEFEFTAEETGEYEFTLSNMNIAPNTVKGFPQDWENDYDFNVEVIGETATDPVNPVDLVTNPEDLLTGQTFEAKGVKGESYFRVETSRTTDKLINGGVGESGDYWLVVSNGTEDDMIGAGSYAWIITDKNTDVIDALVSNEYAMSETFKVPDKQEETFASVDGEIIDALGDVVGDGAMYKAHLWDVKANEVVASRGIGNFTKETNNKLDNYIEVFITPPEEILV
jgi:hypothetical protein